MKRAISLLAVLTLIFTFPASTEAAAPSFTEFESGHVRPLAITPDGTKLLAVNTPDNRLEVFDITASGLTPRWSVPVGMEPVAVAARNNNEAWVVNQLSDSVSIVDISAAPPRVTRTLLVGDEPRDIVFAGSGGNRAFITTARRGQNHKFFSLSDLTTAGLGRADVFVFDAANPGASLEGDPITVLHLFGDSPRALTVSPDGTRVYAAVFHSGNQTTTLSEGIVCNGGAGAAPCTVTGVSVPGGLPFPNGTFNSDFAPEVGLIVKYNTANGKWEDELGRDWTNAVKFNLPDKDVFAINAAANPPVEVASYQHVGTILFNMITNPVSGKVYVSNTDANNKVRFEGPGTNSTTVRGHLAESHITIIDPAGAGTITSRHLNKHIDYEAVPQPAGTKEKSLATPAGMAISNDGSTLYVAAFGSSKIGVFNTAELESNAFIPSAGSHIQLTGGGPSGLVLDTNNNRLYAATRFNNSVAVVDLNTNTQTASYPLYNPEPSSITTGRRFLYDSVFTSSNGEASCSSCHIFGDMDDLAWDLGNPDGGLITIPFSTSDIKLGVIAPFSGVTVSLTNFPPMKGPMTTQTLRGMVHMGAMHWRGDRTGGNDPGGSPFDSNAGFLKFNPAFEGLVGRDEGQIPAQNMQEFADFILQVTLPPNPVRNLDNSLNATQQSGRTSFLTPFMDGVSLVPNTTSFQCQGCHTLNPSQGFFGGNGQMSFENETQLVKVPHLRNLYQKVGMFGMADTSFFLDGDNGHKGDQIRGFGFLHDGSVDTVFRFLRAGVFNKNGTIGFQNGDPERRNVEQFLLAFESDLAPIVGQQITLTTANAATVNARINLLIQRAGTPFPSVNPGTNECDLIVKGVISGHAKGWVYNPSTALFNPDKASDSAINNTALKAFVNTASDALTYTCAPPGSGTRMGIDRDEDGILDGDENTAPAFGSISSEQSVIAGGDALQFTVQGSDANGDNPLNLTFLNAGQSPFEDASFNASATQVVTPGSLSTIDGNFNWPSPGATAEGTYPAGFRISDGLAQSDGTVNIHVYRASLDPYPANPTAINEGQIMNLHAEVTGPISTQFTFNWTLDHQSEVGIAAESTDMASDATAVFGYDMAGQHTIQLEIIGTQPGSPRKTFEWTVNVQDAPPPTCNFGH